jgi:DNA polymerase-2
VLDGLALLRSSFVKLDDYRLDTAAQVILGKGKLFHAEHRGQEIEAAWRNDPARLAAYNLNDARLVVEILERTGLVELTVRRSLLTGMQIDRVGAQIAAVDSLYLAELRARRRGAVHIEDAQGRSSPGPRLDSVPASTEHLVFDFKSLCEPDPHVQHRPDVLRRARHRTCPRPHAERRRVPRRRAGDPARPGRALWEERAQARREGDAVGAQATKILMNSLFGVLGASACRLFSPAVANAITIAGQHVIRLAAAAVEQAGHRVIYGDTDSLFVDAGEPDPAAAAKRAESLRESIGAHVAEALRAEFGCRSWLELEFEKVYERFFMPEVRGGATGSKKRYAGLVDGRPSWSDSKPCGAIGAVARRFQREFSSRAASSLSSSSSATSVADLRAGWPTTSWLTGRRSEAARFCTKTTPPHVKAARKQAGGPGRIVTYVVTTAGPEAVGETTAPPDYDHYVTQQLRPIADALLHFLGAPDFDTIAGIHRPEGRQLGLFGEGDLA